MLGEPSKSSGFPERGKGTQAPIRHYRRLSEAGKRQTKPLALHGARIASVLRWPFDMVDHDELERRLAGFELESELFVDSRED
jgi:hypothetical protein